MIFDKIENLPLYFGTCEAFKVIDAFVKNTDLVNLPCGTVELEGGVKAGISEYAPGEGGLAEAHRVYHDLQFAVCGSENIEVIPLDYCSGSTGYTEDIEFFENHKNPCTVALSEGTFAFLAPTDAHRPGISNGCEKIKKIVFKIPVEG